MPTSRAAAIFCLGFCVLACTDDVTGQDIEETADTDEPSCELKGLVDVDFFSDTESQIETHSSCELTAFGQSHAIDLRVSTDCGHSVELDLHSPFPASLVVGDIVELSSQVDDPIGHVCAESGWLVLEDQQGRMQFAAAAVLPHSDKRIPLGDLGEIELREDTQDGCSGLRLIGQDEEVRVAAGQSAEIEISGARLLVQLGPFYPQSRVGCGTERYGIALFRLPD